MAAALNDIYNRSAQLIQNFTHQEPFDPVEGAREIDELAGELAPHLGNQHLLGGPDRRFIQMSLQELNQARAWVALNAAGLEEPPAAAARPAAIRAARPQGTLLERAFRKVLSIASWFFQVWRHFVNAICCRTPRAARINLPPRVGQRPPAAAVPAEPPAAVPAPAAADPAAAPPAPAPAAAAPAPAPAPVPAAAIPAPLPAIDAAARIAALPILPGIQKQAAGEYLGTFNINGTPENLDGVNRGEAAHAFCALNFVRRLWQSAGENRSLGDNDETRAFIDATVQEGVRLRSEFAGAPDLADPVAVADAWAETFPELLFFAHYDRMDNKIENRGGDNGRRSYLDEITRLYLAAAHAENPNRMLGALLLKGERIMTVFADLRRNNPRLYYFDPAAARSSIRVFENHHAFAAHLAAAAPFAPGDDEANRLQVFPFTVHA